MISSARIYAHWLAAFVLILGGKCAYAGPDGWTHLELGAANYGRYATSPKAFENLKKTLDEIVSTRGNQGVFYVNDIDQDHAMVAAVALKNYVDKRYPHPKFNITVRVVAANYHFPDTLPVAESVHMKFSDDLNFNDNEPDPTYHLQNVKRRIEFLSSLVHAFPQGIRIVTDLDPLMKTIEENLPKDLVIAKIGTAPAYITDKGDRVSTLTNFSKTRRAATAYFLRPKVNNMGRLGGNPSVVGIVVAEDNDLCTAAYEKIRQLDRKSGISSFFRWFR
jgi:hypothetical protein